MRWNAFEECVCHTCASNSCTFCRRSENRTNGEILNLRTTLCRSPSCNLKLGEPNAAAPVLTLVGMFCVCRLRSLDLIEIIAREDSPLFRDFEPRCACCLLLSVWCDLKQSRCILMVLCIRSMLSKLLARVPEILIRMAAQEPEESDSRATSSRHDTLCQFLLTT